MSIYGEISLAGGFVALISAEDYEALSQVRWHVHSNGYVVNRSKRGGLKNVTVRMHTEVIRLHGVDIPEGMEVDHINHDRLDNRFENLRLCDRSHNLANRPYKNSTGYRGVVHHHSGKFVGYIDYKGKRKYTPHFDTVEEAAHARDELAQQTFGEFATLNFVA